MKVDFDIMDMMINADKPDTETEHLEQVQLKNNLVRALGILVKAIQTSTEKKLNLVSALAELQWDKNGKYLEAETHRPYYYELGLKSIQGINPHFTIYSEKSAHSGHTTHPLGHQTSVRLPFIPPFQTGFFGRKDNMDGSRIRRPNGMQAMSPRKTSKNPWRQTIMAGANKWSSSQSI